MTQTNDTCRGGRPSGAHRPGAGRMATRRTRLRVSSDAVVSAYIHDIASPHAAEEQLDPHSGVVECPACGSSGALNIEIRSIEDRKPPMHSTGKL